MTTTPEFVVYDGNPTNPFGNTPFGFFDSELEFQTDGPKVADFVAQRLGYPILDVELKDVNIYTCFEKAIIEYGNQINQFRAQDHALTLIGGTTASVNAQPIIGTPLSTVVRISSQYATEFGMGGPVEMKRGYVSASAFTQSYDLKSLWSDPYESGSALEIRKIYHDLPPSSIRFFSPFHGTTQQYGDLLDVGEGLTGAFGGGVAGGYLSTSFVIFPAYEDLLRIQAIEMNDLIRRSGYSFTISDNIVKFSPVFREDMVIWFDYYVIDDKKAKLLQENPDGNLASDFSNLPFENISYTQINSIGKTWIFKYTLALAKEMLGRVRSKYDTIPIPNQEIKLDGELLLREAQEEQKYLIEEIRETLDKTSVHGQLEREAKNVEFQREILKGSPLGIYIF
ncbi:MAG: hypothetical protein VW683_00510 [Betaproteobacteria bacterium]|jgi:hypothetical protein